MKKSHLILTGFIFLVVAGLAFAAQAVNVGGEWELKMTTPRGERVSQVKFEQDGEKLKVTTTNPMGEEVTGEGTLKGSDIQWSIVRSTPRGEFTVTYTGKVEGDTMKGQAVMGDFGSMDWTAARKKV
ncbi:MAG: hypothetical protein WCB96_02370 [Candidatus Aminicenantales bacterium]